MTIRGFAKATGVSAGTLCRLAHGGSIEYISLENLLRHYDGELADEVSALLNYIRKSLLRRSSKINGSE